MLHFNYSSPLLTTHILRIESFWSTHIIVISLLFVFARATIVHCITYLIVTTILNFVLLLGAQATNIILIILSYSALAHSFSQPALDFFTPQVLDMVIIVNFIVK